MIRQNHHGVGQREEIMNEKNGGQKTLQTKSHFSALFSNSAYSFHERFRNEEKTERGNERKEIREVKSH